MRFTATSIRRLDSFRIGKTMPFFAIHCCRSPRQGGFAARRGRAGLPLAAAGRVCRSPLTAHRSLNSKNWGKQKLRFTATPIRRIEGDKIVSENDIFNPILWIEDIVFPILRIEFAPRRGERQKWHRFRLPQFEELRPRRAAIEVAASGNAYKPCDMVRAN